MTEVQERKAGLIIKGLGTVGAIILFFHGIHQYRKTNEDESAKEFWKQQFPIYCELCKTTASITVTSDTTELAALKRTFWRMYYGDARMVVDSKVHEKLSKYAYTLKMIEVGREQTTTLQLAAFELATACRESMATSWSIPLSRLPENIK